MSDFTAVEALRALQGARFRRKQQGMATDTRKRLTFRPANFLLGAGFVASVLVLTGCGREATEAECMEILERVARLEYQEQLSDADPSDIESRIASAKKRLRAKAKSECVGRRISDASMRCVREAKTAAKIENDCFRWRLLSSR